MARLNVNKLFPRLSIRAKLVIAFAVLTLVPLSLVVAIGAWVTIGRVRAVAGLTLEHDLEMAQVQTGHALREVERHVAYLGSAVLGDLLGERRPDWAAAARTVQSFLAPEPALFRVELVDAEGRLLFVGSAEGGGRVADTEGESGGVYYAWRAAALGPRERLLLPVELRGTGGPGEPGGAIPAVAILVPVRGPTGTLLGVVVGEAYASVLFADLEVSSPSVVGVTGLVDADGLFLYHSARKRDWASLLASRNDVSLQTDFRPEVVAAVLSGRAGSVRTADRLLIGFRPMGLGDARVPPLTLYRVVSLDRLEAPLRRFLGWLALGGLLAVAVVLGLARLAAGQFTKPIYRIREAVHRLAQGGEAGPIEVDTNDELEDLAVDFSATARSLAEHRTGLERLVEERTRALRTTHAELTDILNRSADAIIGLDPDDRVRVWNRGAEALFGFTAAEASGRTVAELIGPRGDSGERELAFIRREATERGAIVNFRATRFTKEGTSVPVSLTRTLIGDEEGRLLGWSLILRDNTLQAKLDEQMRRSERLAAGSVMAGALAHELNNPLAIIGNRIECMQRDARENGQDPVLEKDLDVLLAHVERLRGVTTDLLRFAREERDDPVPVDIGRTVAGVAALLERTFVVRNLRLDVAAAPGLPSIPGHEKAIETVVVNLLLNAADATPSGGAVCAACGLGPSGDTVWIAVTDTGAGIPPELVTRIFEPFFTTKGPRGGTGLGLAVCRNIVERHGGTIRVESAPGEGSTFTVTLPVRGPETAWNARASS